MSNCIQEKKWNEVITLFCKDLAVCLIFCLLCSVFVDFIEFNVYSAKRELKWKKICVNSDKLMDNNPAKRNKQKFGGKKSD